MSAGAPLRLARAWASSAATLRRLVPPELDGARLDAALARLTDRSRARCARIIAAGAVAIDGTLIAKSARRVRAGESIELSEPQESTAAPSSDSGTIDVRLLLEDDHFLVVDKPAGVPTHPHPGRPRGTLLNALVRRWPDLAELGGVAAANVPPRMGIVHRLDAGTSGAMVVARTVEAFKYAAR